VADPVQRPIGTRDFGPAQTHVRASELGRDPHPRGADHAQHLRHDQVAKPKFLAQAGLFERGWVWHG